MKKSIGRAIREELRRCERRWLRPLVRRLVPRRTDAAAVVPPGRREVEPPISATEELLIAVVRAELRRLFRWLKDKGVTAVITGEQGKETLTRHGLEEYVSDCVIFLDHRIINQIATRRLRVVKYRGSSHGTNEYPTMIDEHGLSVLPISSLGLDYGASTERVSSGVERLDAMLGGRGYYRGSSVLVPSWSIVSYTGSMSRKSR